MATKKLPVTCGFIAGIFLLFLTPGCSSGVSGPGADDELCPYPDPQNPDDYWQRYSDILKPYPVDIVDRGIGGGVGYYCSLAFDSEDWPYISYYDFQNRDLRCARLTGEDDGENLWEVEIVDQTGDVGAYCSLAFYRDGNGNDLPRITYRDGSQGNLKLAAFDGEDWTTMILDDQGNTGIWTSLVIDSLGDVHASYIQVGTYDLRYVYYTGDAVPQTIVNGEGGNVDFSTSIVVDPRSNLPYISYYEAQQGNLFLARKDPLLNLWISTPINDSDEDVGRFNSLTVDDQGYLHLCYMNETRGELWYARYDTTREYFEKEAVDSQGLSGAYCDIAIRRGEPVISYFEESGGDLRVAWKSQGRWKTYKLDTSGVTGFWTSVAVNSNNVVGVAYRSQTPDALRFRYLPPE